MRAAKTTIGTRTATTMRGRRKSRSHDRDRNRSRDGRRWGEQVEDYDWDYDCDYDEERAASLVRVLVFDRPRDLRGRGRGRDGRRRRGGPPWPPAGRRDDRRTGRHGGLPLQGSAIGVLSPSGSLSESLQGERAGITRGVRVGNVCVPSLAAASRGEQSGGEPPQSKAPLRGAGGARRRWMGGKRQRGDEDQDAESGGSLPRAENQRRRNSMSPRSFSRRSRVFMRQRRSALANGTGTPPISTTATCFDASS